MVAALRPGAAPVGTCRWRAGLHGPPSVDHGATQHETGRLIGNHLAGVRNGRRVITTPGVIPRARSDSNERIPELGITCSPIRPDRSLPDPVVLIEILSPSNEARTRADVWAHLTIPTVIEVLVLSSTGIRAELLRRGAGSLWPEMPPVIDADQTLRLASIGFEARLRDLYATSSLAGASNERS